MRRPFDFYPTPRAAVTRLLDNVEFPPGLWLEPTAGDGMIIRAVKADYGDLVTWDACDIREECLGPLTCSGTRKIMIGDFLNISPERRYQVILGNPPYSLAQPIVEHSLKFRAEKTAFLLPLGFLASQRRAPFLTRRMADVYVLSERPSFDGQGTDRTDYAWFVWPKHNQASGSIQILR